MDLIVVCGGVGGNPTIFISLDSFGSKRMSVKSTFLLISLIFLAASSDAKGNKLSTAWTVIADRSIGYQFEVPVLPKRLTGTADYPAINNVVIRSSNGFIRRVQNYIPDVDDYWLGSNEFMLEISVSDQSRFDLEQALNGCVKEPTKLLKMTGGRVCEFNQELLEGDGCTTRIATFNKSGKVVQMFLCGSALSAKDQSRIFRSIVPIRAK